jgi:hypothetical protein
MMKLNSHVLRMWVAGLVMLAGLPVFGPAQAVFLPDSDLNAAICDALQKPVGPLTQADLLSLTNLVSLSLEMFSRVSRHRHLPSLSCACSFSTSLSSLLNFFPNGVSRYSTRGGISGNTTRSKIPAR